MYENRNKSQRKSITHGTATTPDNVLLESDDMEMSASENIATKMPVDVARGASAGW